MRTSVRQHFMRLQKVELHKCLRGDYLNIIIHNPTSERGVIELRRRVAIIHAEAVERFVEKLSCPKGQKIKLIESVQAVAKTR